MGFYETASGARLHAALYRPFENRFNYFNAQLVETLSDYLSYFLFFFKNFFQPLVFFRVVKLRFVGVGVLSSEFARLCSISGVIARSTGLKYDVRTSSSTSYAYYPHLAFSAYTGSQGDLYDRMLLMTAEIVESTIIISQVIFRSFLSTSKPRKANKTSGLRLVGH